MPREKKCAACGANADTDYASTCWQCGKNYEEARQAKKAGTPKRPTAS